LVFVATIALVVACEAQFQPAARQDASPSPLVLALLAGNKKAMDEGEAAFAKATEGVLTAEQKARLAQLIVQCNASKSLSGALAESWTAKSLGISPEQIVQLRTREQDSLHLCDTIVNLKDPDEKLVALLRAAVDNRLLSILADAQRAEWKELMGEAWQGLQQRLPVQVSNP
jgi:hypothetical protein